MSTTSVLDTVALNYLRNAMNNNPPKPAEPVQEFEDIKIPELDTNTTFEEEFGVPTPSGQPLSFKKYRDDQWPEEIRGDIPEVDPNHIWDYEWLEAVILANNLGLKVSTYGPPGSGKTTSYLQLAAVLRQPFYRFNGRGDMESDTIIGKAWVRDHGMEYVLGEFPVKMRYGYMVLFDEWTKTPAQIQMTLQAAYERNGILQLDDMVLEPGEPVSKKQIKPHPEFKLFFSDNVVGNGDSMERYAASNIQDQSTLNRIDVFYFMDYHKPEQEKEIILRKYPKISDTRAGHMIQFCNNLRTSVKQGKLNMEISPRQIEAWAMQVQILNDYIRPMKYTIMNRASTDSEKALILNQFETVFNLKVPV